MKRFPAQIGITYFSVLCAAFYLYDKIVWIVGGIALAAAIIFFFVRKIRKTIFIPAMALAVVIACLVHIGYGAFIVQPMIERYGDHTHTVKAILTDEPYQSYSKYYYRLKTTEIDGDSVSRKLLLKTAYLIDADPDDTLTFTSMLKVTENDYYRAKGYYLVSDSFGTVIESEAPQTHSLYYRAIQLRSMMRKALDRYLPEDCASLCKAVLIGDKYAMTQDIRDDFRYAGASYFIVVSGMHFAVICLLWMRVLRRLNRWVRLALMMAFILMYAAITGFQSSVLRAGIMMAFTVIGTTVRRQTYPLNHLGFAGIIMPFIVSPYGAGDVGLILSFYATLSILLWAGPIADKLCKKDDNENTYRFQIGNRIAAFYERIKARIKRERTPDRTDRLPFSWRIFLYKLWNAVAVLLSVSLAANILVFPITVFLFREFSLVTLFSGVLLYIPIYLILLSSLFLTLLSWLKPIAVVLAVPLALLCRFVLWIVSALASLPFAYYRVGEGFIYIWVAVSILLGIVVLLYRDQYHSLRTAALCSAVILLGGILAHGILESQVLSLEVYACGDGMCVGINNGGNLHLLSMNANTKELYPLWAELSSRYGGAKSALCLGKKKLRDYQLYQEDEFAICELMLYDDNKEIANIPENAVTFQDDSVFAVDDDVSIRVAVENDTPVPFVTVGEKKILIVPSGCMIDDIPKELRSADVIVLNTAADGMDQLRCDLMIISDDSDFAYDTADALNMCYAHVSTTECGDVRYRLR